MKGSVAQGEAGGGGKSEREEFSMLGLLLRIATLATALSLVFAGYLLERRRQNNKLSFEKKVYSMKNAKCKSQINLLAKKFIYIPMR